jgi:hypothetical protein
MDLIQRLITRWADHGIAIRSGAPSDALDDFETRHRLKLPSDFRAYLAAVDGMGEDGTCDEDMFCFFQLADLRTIADLVPDRVSSFPDAQRFVIFADHSISLPSFAIRLTANATDATPVASVFTDGGALGVQEFFDSFTDFLQSYLDGPIETSVLLPSSD